MKGEWLKIYVSHNGRITLFSIKKLQGLSDEKWKFIMKVSIATGKSELAIYTPALPFLLVFFSSNMT